MLRLVLLVIAIFLVALGVRLVLIWRLEHARRIEEEEEAKFQERLARERKEGKR